MDKARWIASYPKSGNTWVRAFLNAYITGNLNINHMPVTVGDVHYNKMQQVANYPLKEMGASDTLWYRHASLLNMMIDTKETVIFKTHNANITVNGLEMIPESLTFSSVYIVRDPRAVAVSYGRHSALSMDKTVVSLNDPDHYLPSPSCESIGAYVSSWSNHVQSWMNAKFKTTIIRYEDLIANPEALFTEILETYKFKVDKKRLKKAIKLCTMDNMKKQEFQNGFRERMKQERFFGGSKDWREVLTGEQVRRIENDHGELMRQFNYLEANNGSIQQVPRLPRQRIAGI